MRNLVVSVLTCIGHRVGLGLSLDLSLGLCCEIIGHRFGLGLSLDLSLGLCCEIFLPLTLCGPVLSWFYWTLSLSCVGLCVLYILVSCVYVVLVPFIVPRPPSSDVA
jgi:hypothetical protein